MKKTREQVENDIANCAKCLDLRCLIHLYNSIFREKITKEDIEPGTKK